MKIYSVIKVCIAFSLPFVFNLNTMATDAMNGPDSLYSKYEKVNDAVEFEDISFSAYPVFSLIVLYQKSVANIASAGCPSYPSCSRYMQMSMRDYGAGKGFIMGIDRLLHESGELANGQFIQTDRNKWLVYDPPSANALWSEQKVKIRIKETKNSL